MGSPCPRLWFCTSATGEKKKRNFLSHPFREVNKLTATKKTNLEETKPVNSQNKRQENTRGNRPLGREEETQGVGRVSQPQVGEGLRIMSAFRARRVTHIHVKESKDHSPCENSSLVSLHPENGLISLENWERKRD